jgi:hypothetical protein
MAAYSSAPSRQRSLTPQKMLTPSWWSIMLRIISVNSTVLPTPAPPKRPALPPRSKGVNTSMTLIDAGLEHLRRGGAPGQRRRCPVHRPPVHAQALGGRQGHAAHMVGVALGQDLDDDGIVSRLRAAQKEWEAMARQSAHRPRCREWT